jgi:acyl-CoA thioesterase I
MFIGDSITGTPGCWRAPVWVSLTDSGHEVDMVGPSTENACGAITNAAGEPWDPDNFGIGGITTTDMATRLATEDVLATADPQVIVMLLGTNDLFGGASADQILGEYSALLALYREHDPSISVVVGTPPPMTQEVCGCVEGQEALAAALPGWAIGASTSESPVTVADLSTGFDAATDTYDGVHPNDTGTAKLAAAWTPVIAAALDGRLIAASDTSPQPSATDAGQDDGAADADGPTARGWIVLALVTVIAGLVTLAMTRRRPPQP